MALLSLPSALSAAVPANQSQLVANYGKLPLRFEPNRGQAADEVKFLARGSNYGLYLTAQQAVLALHSRVPGDSSIRTSVVRMNLDGSNPQSSPSGESSQPGATNYIASSDPASWHTGLPGYGRIRYHAVYPGIDLVYYGNQQQLEYDFVVAPGASPAPIRLSFAGASNLALDSAGNLVIAAGDTSIAFHKPVVYQTIHGHRRPVEGRFALLADRSAGFEIGSYDHSRPLVIDPTLSYSTWLGGSTSDTLSAIAIDGSGNAYITGYTSSTDYPITPGVYQTTPTSAFVTKLNASGSALVYSTFLGSGGTGTAIAVDSSGEAVVCGYTGSATFPVTAGVLQSTNLASSSSNQTGFLTKLNATGTALVYSTFLGGSQTDEPLAIALDSSNDVYLAGYAFSSNFKTTPGVVQTTNNSAPDDGWNEYVVKINPTATALLYSTLLGGSDEYSSPPIVRLAVDSAGDAYVSAAALSADFPTTTGSYQPKTNAKPGYYNMTLTKFNPTATKLLYSTYIGGTGNSYGDDVANGLAIDTAGDVYLTGTTHESNFPVTSGAYQTTNGGGVDYANAFILKMNPAGSALVYSTYLGGNGQDYGYGLAIDSAGDAYITGTAYSANFPVTSNAYQSQNNAAFNNGSNAFLTEMNPKGSALVYSTYFGGSAEEEGHAIALTSSGAAYLIGDSGSTDFPTTPGAYKRTYNSQYFTTGFVAEFNFGSASKTLPTQTTLLSNANPAVVGTNMVYTVTVAPTTGTGVPTGTVVFNIDQVNVTTVTLNSSGTATYATAPLKVGQHAILATYSGSTTYSASANNIVENIVPATPTINPPQGTYPAAQLVTLGDGTANTVIYYTTDGRAVFTRSTKYTAPILVNTPEVISAIAVLSGVPASAVASAGYSLVSAPSSLAVPATSLSTTGATFNALVNTYGMSGTYYFRYGVSSTALTSVTPTRTYVSSTLGSRLSFIPVQLSASVTGLTTKTRYYYQVVMTTAAGASSGQILSFTTN